jgi:hypothetical protein
MWLDGDMAGIIMPADAYKPVMKDPLALKALIHHDQYAAPNRFFIHWFMQMYYKNLPFLLEKFFTPIQSVFIATALARTAIQTAIIYLLAAGIAGTYRLWNKRFLFAALLITPFFQTNGFEQMMSVTMNSITYTFFYALPYVFLLLYFLPFYFKYVLQKEIIFTPLKNILLVLLLFIICLGGPLASPIVLIICTLSLFYLFIKNYRQLSVRLTGKIILSIKNIDRKILFHFSCAIFLALYSIYIGRFNIENEWATIPLIERYQLMPRGLWTLLTPQKFNDNLIFALGCCFLFYYGFRKYKNENIISLMKWIGLFVIIYLILLPLGGYRVYRPLIIRNDTFSPVTLSIFFFYATTGMLLYKAIGARGKKFLFVLFAVVAFIYMNADKELGDNSCQKESLRKMAESDQPVVELRDWCTVMSWEPVTNKDESDLNAQLIRLWKITPVKKLYYSPQ